MHHLRFDAGAWDGVVFCILLFMSRLLSLGSPEPTAVVNTMFCTSNFHAQTTVFTVTDENSSSFVVKLPVPVIHLNADPPQRFLASPSPWSQPAKSHMDDVYIGGPVG